VKEKTSFPLRLDILFTEFVMNHFQPKSYLFAWAHAIPAMVEFHRITLKIR